ncbi:transcription termination factor 2 [Vanessa cardui]|uniref:transcription termination factor 2 n=1 Tax=Vanessa cardui TaxID=171605 RepID=UPI001F13EBDF|nr:transcription termination factor 2 [Vanessa cardui]
MENSFFEYRDKTGVGSDSDTEFIDNSLMEESFTPKTPGKKNQTAFVPESDDSLTGGESEEENASKNVSKTITRRSSAQNYHIILSSDDDQSKSGSIRKKLNSSKKMVVSSSEDEEQVSPEIIPKRRPRIKETSRSSDSFIIPVRKTKKRMILDSDTENSIIIEHDKNKKLACLKDTPLKIDDTKKKLFQVQNMSFQSNDSIQISDDDEDGDDNDNDEDEDEDEKRVKSQESDSNDDHAGHIDTDVNVDDKKVDDIVQSNDDNDDESQSINDADEDLDDSGSNKNRVSTSDEGPDEDQMLMSRATRMSIMGVIPKEHDSDDSDFIQYDDTNPTSRSSSAASLSESRNLETSVNKTLYLEPDVDEASRISCSPIKSPLRDITNEIEDSTKDDPKAYSPEICDLTGSEPSGIRNKVLNNLSKVSNVEYKENKIDDDITIIDTKPEIIALSSDDEEEIKDEKKSPKIKKSPKGKTEEAPVQRVSSDIKQYLLPPSYPNQVVYVKKHVRENELSKLNGLREDLQNIRYLLENMDVATLPDGGVKLIERLTALEADVRRQGDKVAAMVVEPDEPTAEDVAKDGFAKEDKGLSWDDIQKASNAVQPRMFGKQAMATHMAERNLILERLRDLHAALASRPPEHAHAPQPGAVRSALMPHQLHALAWLTWRETQRPRGGVLADDMGLGKTITMISLIVSDKEKNLDNDDEDEDDYPDKGRLAQGGTLVVCPASLLQQWAGEVSTHCGAHALSVCAHHGAARALQPRRLAAADLVLTTYNILQRESEKGGVLTRVFWRRVILDEAHAVRNHKAATSQAVCALRAARRWALTGTPLHNKDLDLFALLKFLRCTPFDDLAMWKKWIDNKSQGGQERLNTVMRCIMLRRTKQQLQERGQLKCLPQRTEHQQDVTLDTDEMNVYQKVLVFSKTLFAQFLHQRAERQADAQGFLPPGKDSQYAKVHKQMIALQGAKPVKSHEILVLLLRLRQVCGHCGLIASMLDPDDAPVDEDLGSKDLLAELNKLTLDDSRSRRKSGEKKKDEEEEEEAEGTTAAEAIRSVLSPNNPVFDLQRRSAKIRAVMECLQENVFKNKGEKAVVVSQWTSVLSLVERELRVAKVRCVTLSGRVPVPARPPLIAALNDARSDVRVMLLSLCAGGVGLNLVGANHLLLLDPHWNPQLEQQAQDRIFRVGQTKHVHIYRFTCLDTVEQSIRQLQKAKLELADNVLTGAKNNTASKLTIEDLKLLFNMGPQSTS